ncbi:carbohydrate ABC transporter permease [Pseudactinotalea terrae]|uniref:carbohydrate ABC transporter permease n=1 Tax=Pseudactinotalea terrae TaxID=1743262 RepID=UPI0012E1418E|nr:sugar ABC transporter permease [Pseudactinotalea terrae]
MTTPVTGAGAPRSRSGTRARRKARWSFDNISFFLVFLGLPLALFLLLVIWPFIQAVFYSFTDWGGFSQEFEIIGFANYERLVNDATFKTALGNNIKLAIVVPFAVIVIAMIFATLVTVGGRGIGQTVGVKNSGFYRVVSFFPYVIPAVVAGVIFTKVFDPSNGLLNGLLPAGLRQNWLGQVSTALPASMFVIIWGAVGFYMLLFIAAIKAIPAETFEAARLDGAGRLRTMWSVTIPSIRENIQTAWIYLGIAALDAFVFMHILNNSGGPDNSTLVMPQYLFRLAFAQSQFGYASAVGVAMAVVTLVFAGLVFAINRLTGGSTRSN